MYRIVRCFFFLFVAFFCCLPVLSIEAREIETDIRNGSIYIMVTDTTKSSNTVWRVEGFTIKAARTYGNPTRNPKAEIWIKEKENKDRVIYDKITVTTYHFPKFWIDNKLKEAGITKEILAENQNCIYLNAIIQVYTIQNTKLIPKGRFYYTLNEIKNAESWANTDDFNDHFDIPLFYFETSCQVNLTFMEKWNNKKIKMEMINMGNKEVSFKVNIDSEIVPLKKKNPRTGNYCYLYRTHWSKLSDSINKETGIRLARDSLFCEINPLTNWEVYKQEIERISNRIFLVPEEGLEIVALYREWNKKELDKDKIIQEIVEPTREAVLYADSRGNEKFDVEKGIPTKETLYANVNAHSYLSNYCFSRIEDSNTYTISVKKDYQLSWTEKNIYWDAKQNKYITTSTHKSDRVTKVRVYQIKRRYVYWKVDGLHLYEVDSAILKNYALPDGIVKLNATKSTIPKIEYKETKDHIIEPKVNDIVLSISYLSGGDTRPDIPQEDWREIAEKSVGKIKVRNDFVLFGKDIIMDSSLAEEETLTPKSIPVCTTKIDKDILYQSGLKISDTKANGQFNSTGILYYREVLGVGNLVGEYKKGYLIDNINNIVIHTPVVCKGKVEDRKKYTQLLKPDKEIPNLVLDQFFRAFISPTGQHKNIKGYGYQNYRKYIEKKQVKFPFDVYLNNQYQKRGNWITIEKITSFYLPIWVNEGRYTIKFRTVSINATENNALAKIEKWSNLSLEHYTAFDKVVVEVSGRIYGLHLYDISDYPLWRNVFRAENSLKKTKRAYYVGLNNQNGKKTKRQQVFTLPLLKGSHPKFLDSGILKSGYTLRMGIETIGNMFSENNFIKIHPKFYYIKKDGSDRQEVDLYYQETINGTYQYLIKAGSKKDKENKKYLSLGDSYLSVDKEELENTAKIKNISLAEIFSRKYSLFSYKEICIPTQLQTVVGKTYLENKKLNIPKEISDKKIILSKQNWYFEYQLPAKFYLVSKGYPVYEYIKNQNIDLKESFWLKDGYLILNFDIETIMNGKRHLSYSNKQEKYCNMWQTEGFQTKKISSDKITFTLKEGDICFYSITQSSASDYIAGGTH